MKYLFLVITAVAFLLLSGCGAGKQLTQQNATANSYYIAGNFSNALSSYDEIIKTYESNNNSEACPVYTNAGESALKTGDASLAVNYLKKATYTTFANEDTYYYLADAYKQIDNLSLEIGALTDYLDKYPQGKETNHVKTRIFYTAVESTNYDKALSLWPDVLANNENDTKLLGAYLEVNKKLGNTDTCDDVANQLLSLDENNITALTWFGKKYYRKAEDLYRKEMKAYENHKTNKQYRILLKALDAVTVDFKKSLTYFKKLYTLEPTVDNANYLSHIYGRLSDKKRKHIIRSLLVNHYHSIPIARITAFFPYLNLILSIA